MWRFDIDNNVAPAGNEAFLLGKATSPGGTAQAISVRPQLAEIVVGGSKVALVSFGTGRYLGATDLTDTTTQSLYVIKDNLSVTSLGAIRTNVAMVKQTMSAAHALSNPAAVNYATNAGWYIDFDKSSKERVTVEMQQQLTTLTVATNIPGATACSPGGTGYLYYFDLPSAKVLQSQLFTTPIVGISTILVGTEGGRQGTPVTEVTGGDGVITPVVDPTLLGTSGLTPRRTSWRELVK
jgi:type IV pilus assembly protein PilY1